MQRDGRHSTRATTLRAAALSLLAIASTAAAAAETRDVCAERFHAALGGLAVKQVGEIDEARTQLLTVDTALSGTWMFFKREDRIKARLAQRLREGALQQGDKVCAHTTADRGGRVRCLKWVDRSTAPPRPQTDTSAVRDTPMTKGDLALIAQLQRFVRGRGVFEEFDKNGRFSFLVSRTSEELGDYVRQPLRPGLCAGAVEVMGFYDNAFSPMRKRIDVFKRQRDDAHAWVNREFRRLRADNGDATGQTSEPAGSAGTTRKEPEELLREVTERYLSTENAKRLTSAPNDLLARLASVEDALMTPPPPTGSDPGKAAEPAISLGGSPGSEASPVKSAATPTAPTPEETREPNLVPFLRAVEAFAYADLVYTRSMRLDDAYKALMQGVIAASNTNCTCDR